MDDAGTCASWRRSSRIEKIHFGKRKVPGRSGTFLSNCLRSAPSGKRATSSFVEAEMEGASARELNRTLLLASVRQTRPARALPIIAQSAIVPSTDAPTSQRTADFRREIEGIQELNTIRDHRRYLSGNLR